MHPARFLSTTLATSVLARPAEAHVKWFAPYIVDASPRPQSATLTDPFFLLGIALVLFFFFAARMTEPTQLGIWLSRSITRIGAPLDRRLDDFLRASIAAFFIAIFSVGGVYITPDLKTDNAVIPWVQLAIAIFIFFRPTMPFAAICVVALWVTALRDYELFHLLDYLALGLGVAGYLCLAAAKYPPLYRARFDALRWGVAIALMWSSMEKFAYPDWFYPLVAAKPYLTFGLPRDAFIPMAGVAEFTLGFGLLSSALIRRLSALALFVIFNAAVYPFGRIDLIGHGLIMAALVAIAVNAWDEDRSRQRKTVGLLGISAGLAVALVLFSSLYWGSHGLIYSPDDSVLADRQSAHGSYPDHAHDLADENIRSEAGATQIALLQP
ncbi:MAG: DUF305 domain-containing protein [Gemmobacter sp.]